MGNVGKLSPFPSEKAVRRFITVQADINVVVSHGGNVHNAAVSEVQRDTVFGFRAEHHELHSAGADLYENGLGIPRIDLYGFAAEVRAVAVFGVGVVLAIGVFQNELVPACPTDEEKDGIQRQKHKE